MKNTPLAFLAAILASSVTLALAFYLARGGGGVEVKPVPPPPRVSAGEKPVASPREQIALPRVEQRVCTAVAILLDSSSSMRQEVKARSGGKQPKFRLAREALERIIEHTEATLLVRADLHLELGIYQFSSDVEVLRPLRSFVSAVEARAVLEKVRPSSGTAIGRALEMGFRDLNASGCTRQHIVCITDGENTSGPSPDRIAEAFHQATNGEVAIHFVAFDIDAKKFRFLERVNGRAVEASDEAELQMQLTEIYDKRILAEAPLPEPAAEAK